MAFTVSSVTARAMRTEITTRGCDQGFARRRRRRRESVVLLRRDVTGTLPEGAAWAPEERGGVTEVLDGRGVRDQGTTLMSMSIGPTLYAGPEKLLSRARYVQWDCSPT